MNKHYIIDIVTDYEIHDALPEKVEVVIDLPTALEIVRVAVWLQETTSGAVFRQSVDLAKFLRYDPDLSSEKASADPCGNIMQNYAQRLNVSTESFMVSAMISEWDFEVQTVWLPVASLIEHFNLDPGSISSPVRQFAQTVAGMSIWDYSKDDGTLYEECTEPSDGYLDSHCALMNAIEDARKLLDPK